MRKKINNLLIKLITFFFSIDELNPMSDWHTNAVLKGNKQFPDIPVTQLGDKVVSVWKANSLITRLKFLFTGKINFQILAQTHAPVSISIGEYERALESGESND